MSYWCPMRVGIPLASNMWTHHQFAVFMLHRSKLNTNREVSGIGGNGGLGTEGREKVLASHGGGIIDHNSGEASTSH